MSLLPTKKRIIILYLRYILIWVFSFSFQMVLDAVLPYTSVVYKLKSYYLKDYQTSLWDPQWFPWGIICQPDCYKISGKEESSWGMYFAQISIINLLTINVKVWDVPLVFTSALCRNVIFQMVSIFKKSILCKLYRIYFYVFICKVNIYNAQRSLDRR